MKNMNIPLIFGIILIFILLSIAIFPSLFTESNPYAMTLVHTYIDENGKLIIMTPPFEPGDNYVLGSDEVGRDIWSLVVNGTRLTLTLALGITFLRFLLAIPFGIAGAMGFRSGKSIIDQFNIVLTTIPPLLIGILVLKLDFFTSLYKLQSILVFISTLTIIGWARIGNMIYEGTSKIMEETFILSEKAIGKTKFRIALNNVLPHLLPEIVVLFFMEISRVLTLMMQLGIFGVFVGNIRIISNSGNQGYSYYNLPYEPEWSGLLGAAKEFIRSAPWIVFSATAFFVISVLAFNLFGEGIRIELQKKNSKLISGMKGMVKRDSKTTKDLQITFFVAIVISSILLGSIIVSRLEDNYQYFAVNEIGYNYKNIIEGSEESTVTGKYIENYFNELGIVKLKDTYSQKISGINKLYFENSMISLMSESGEKVLEFGEDIMIKTGLVGEFAYDIVNITENFYDITDIDINNRLVYVNSDIITFEAIENNAEYFAEEGAKGIITTSSNISYIDSENNPDFFIVLEDSFKDILSKEDTSLSLSLNSKSYQNEASNIIGFIEGKDPVLSKKAIIIGMDYGFINQENSYEVLNFYLGLVKSIKENEDMLKKSIIFIFYPDKEDGVQYFSEHQVFPQKNVILYLDLTNIHSGKFDKIKFSDELSPITRYYGFTFANQLNDLMKPIISDIPIPIDSQNSYLYLNNGMTTLLFETEGSENYSIDEFGKNLVDLIINNAH